MTYPCPCCGFLTLSEEGSDTYEVCPVCFWEDDGLQALQPDFAGGANTVSLNEARSNFKEFGACTREDRRNVRKPKESEKPEGL